MRVRLLVPLLAVTLAGQGATAVALVVNRRDAGPATAAAPAAADAKSAVAAKPIAKAVAKPQKPAVPREPGVAKFFAMPTGDYVRLPDSFEPDIFGAVDLKKAAKIDASRNAVEGLRVLGFQRGHIRGWSAVGGAHGFVTYIYEFKNPDGSRNYLRGLSLARERGGFRSFAVPGIPGAVGLRGTISKEQMRVVFVAVGRRLMMVSQLGGSAAPSNRAVIDQARRQYRVLAAAPR